MTPTREDVLAAARGWFGEAELNQVLPLLDQYGSESHEPEVNRVKLAILALSEGKMDKLQYFVKLAKVDYRDVLAARQPGPMSPEEGAKWQAMARTLIDQWGKK